MTQKMILVKDISLRSRTKDYAKIYAECKAIGFDVRNPLNSIPDDAAEWVIEKLQGKNPPPFSGTPVSEKKPNLVIKKEVERIDEEEPVEIIEEESPGEPPHPVVSEPEPPEPEPPVEIVAEEPARPVEPPAPEETPAPVEAAPAAVADPEPPPAPVAEEPPAPAPEPVVVKPEAPVTPPVRRSPSNPNATPPAPKPAARPASPSEVAAATQRPPSAPQHPSGPRPGTPSTGTYSILQRAAQQAPQGPIVRGRIELPKPPQKPLPGAVRDPRVGTRTPGRPGEPVRHRLPGSSAPQGQQPPLTAAQAEERKAADKKGVGGKPLDKAAIEKDRRDERERAKGIGKPKAPGTVSKRDLLTVLEEEDFREEIASGGYSESTIVDVSKTVTQRPPRAVVKTQPGSSGSRGKKKKKAERIPEAPRVLVKSEIVEIADSMILRDVAEAFGVSVAALIGEFIKQGKLYSINQVITTGEIQQAGTALEIEVVLTGAGAGRKHQSIAQEADKSEWIHRAPVVTVMGHVDHGKTSLLDAIRETRVIESEAGGITQHIGAYQVQVKDHPITFLDTPGHEAFSAMRARGAHVTDVVILVVAADDGVQPQTREAINHARSAKVPMIVAINKIDKDGANPTLVKTMLMNEGVVPEEYGGDTIAVEISAKKRLNLDALLEMILLQSEVLELRARHHGPAQGTVIEARLDKQRGPVATVLIQAGTLKAGDSFVVGDEVGKVRVMTNDRGERIDEAGPSTPVEITGLAGVPRAGEILEVVENERIAREMSQERKLKSNTQGVGIRTSSHTHLEDIHKALEAGKSHDLRLVVKADVQGSVEAVTDALLRLSTQNVTLRILHSGVGNITESDVMLAAAADAIILGFTVGVEGKARSTATADDVDIRLYDIIYEALEDIQKAMKGLLAPVRKEEILGTAEVLQVFNLTKAGAIAGSMIKEGKFVRNSFARITRGTELVYDGKVRSLKRFKEDVREVLQGFECGVGLDGFNEFKQGDKIICFRFNEVNADGEIVQAKAKA